MIGAAPRTRFEAKRRQAQPKLRNISRGLLMKHILIVDDSAVIRKVARRIFENLQFRTAEAEDGKAALALCRDTKPDVILLDWNMPGMDSYDFLKELRKTPEGREPKVVFCLSENDAGRIVRAMHAGADDYMMKPFDQEIVRAKFQEIGLI
jgi:two-component system chemotaxis response regulator CheY